ncbi:MAG: hypothetical protein ACLT98_15100 [Eggerthellaceae bacterium]
MGRLKKEIAEHVGLSKPTRPSSQHHEKGGIVSVEHIGTVRAYHPSKTRSRGKIQLFESYRFVEEEVSKETCPKIHTFKRERNIDEPDASD